MMMRARRNVAPLAGVVLLSACLNEDIAAEVTASGTANQLLKVAGEAVSYTCVVAVYRPETAARPPELAPAFEAWSDAPLKGRVNETSIEMRAIGNASECWNAEIRSLSGSADPWAYIADAAPLLSFDHGGLVAIFDARRQIFMVIDG